MSKIKHYIVNRDMIVELDQACDMSLVYMFDHPKYGDIYIAEVLDGEATMLKCLDGWCYSFSDAIDWVESQPSDGETYLIFEVGYYIDGYMCEAWGVNGKVLWRDLAVNFGLDASDPDSASALDAYIYQTWRFDHRELDWHRIVDMYTADGDWSSEHVEIFESTVAAYVHDYTQIVNGEVVQYGVRQ